MTDKNKAELDINELDQVNGGLGIGDDSLALGVAPPPIAGVALAAAKILTSDATESLKKPLHEAASVAKNLVPDQGITHMGPV